MNHVIIDTSVWVDFFRNVRSNCGPTVVDLLDTERVVMTAPTKLELLAGASKADALRLQRLFQALPELTPLEPHWQQAEDWAIYGASKGHHFGMGDLLLAAIAGVESIPLWSLDQDFARMERLGFIRRFCP